MMQPRSRNRWLLGSILLIAGWASAAGQRAAPPQPPIMATRLYTGADGQSHIDQIAIFLHAGASVNDRADSDALKMSDAYVVRCAPGMFEDWHNADKKRFIVVVSGEAEVTTTGGEKASIVPGHIYMAEDLTGKGHTFRVVGSQPWVALFVNFAPETALPAK